MADRWQYVNEGPVHLVEVASVKGQDAEDVWCDLIEGLEFAPEWEPKQPERVTSEPVLKNPDGTPDTFPYRLFGYLMVKMNEMRDEKMKGLLER
jgi:hypothetical protein